MIKNICSAGFQVEIIAQIVFDAEFKGALQVLVGRIEINDKLKHLTLDGFTVFLPNVMADNIRNLRHQHSMGIDESLLQPRQDSAYGSKTQRGEIVGEPDLGKFFRILF